MSFVVKIRRNRAQSGGTVAAIPDIFSNLMRLHAIQFRHCLGKVFQQNCLIVESCPSNPAWIEIDFSPCRVRTALLTPCFRSSQSFVASPFMSSHLASLRLQGSCASVTFSMMLKNLCVSLVLIRSRGFEWLFCPICSYSIGLGTVRICHNGSRSHSCTSHLSNRQLQLAATARDELTNSVPFKDTWTFN